MSEPTTWREVLGQLIEDSRERDRLAKEVRVRSVTLQRWATGVSKPHASNLRLLTKAMPADSYALFMRLLLVDYPELLQDEVQEDHLSPEIPGEFYARALSNLAVTPQPMFRQAMQDLLLQQMLEHLDPERHGLAITIALCVQPRFGRKVRSLREIGGLGTPPWSYNLTGMPMFLGAESLVGYAVSHMRSYVLNSREEHTFCPAHWTRFENSAAVYPLLCQGRIVGGLIVSSALESFFTRLRLLVIERYTDLLSCMFEFQEGYEAAEIDLKIMPTQAQQLPFLLDYNQQVSRHFIEATQAGQLVTLQQIHQVVWQEIEDRLLSLVYVQR